MKFQKNNKNFIYQGKRHKKHVEKVPFFDAFKNLLGGNFLNILEIELTELIPYENNPRNNDEAVESVVNFDLSDNKVLELATWDLELLIVKIVI